MLLLLSELLLILLLVLLVHEGQEVGLLVHMLLTKAEVLFVLSGFLNEFQSASGLLFGTDRQGIVSHQRAFLGQPAGELICCKRCRSSRIIHHESIRPQVHVKGRAISADIVLRCCAGGLSAFRKWLGTGHESPHPRRSRRLIIV